MDLTDQIVSNTNEICIQDSLNASLMKLKVKMGATSVAPISNDMIVYVDRQPSSSPTTERKQYVFNLTGPLKYCNEISDELIEQFKMVDNKVQIEAFVKRKVGTNESGNYILETSTVEELDASIITLFEGVNYIYTNYSNGEITIIYPKDNGVTRAFLNNATFYEHLMNDEDDFNLDDIYFKNAFTQSGNKLNLEVDNACVECITSKNNKFSLDSEGNLIVKSITCFEGLTSQQAICNLIYPIGSIYISVNGSNPAALFGIGTWEQIRDKFLLSCGDNYMNGDIGGEASHILTVDEMPSHTHKMEYNGAQLNSDQATSGWYPGYQMAMTQKWSMDNPYWYVGASGGNSPHNNMPPFVAVYMWKRTA